MSDSGLQLLFSAILDKNYEKRLKEDLDKIREHAGRPIDIKIQADPSGNARKIILETVDVMGRLTQATYQYENVAEKGKPVQMEWVRTQTKLVSSMEKTHAQALKEIADRERQIDLVKKQTIAQQSLLNQIDKHQRSNQAFVDRGGFSQEYVKLAQDINNLDPAHKNFTTQLAEQKLNFQKLSKEVGLYKQSIQEGTRFTHVFGEQIVEAGRKFLTWYLLGNVIVSTLGKIRDGVQFIKDLDKDLTEVSMITGVTREETRQLALEYANLGHEMAKTVGEISAVNKELIRQGLAMDVARERLESILKLSAAANISTDDSLKIITSSVNAMGESAEKTSDVLLLAGAISASSAEQIGEAFTKTASSARATGMSLENLTGILATLIEVTQESPSSLGNSMKTLLARFNKINEETGELNEELNNVHKAFESVGIDFLDAADQIRPVDELLEELSYKWKDLDKNTQMYLATQIAGVRQQNRLLALMENYSRSLEISNELTDAAGTTNLHYARYLNSVEAAANRTQVAFEQLWIKTINSDVLKYFYNMATSVVTLIDKIGGLRIVFTLLVLVLMNLRKNVSAFFTNLMLLPAAFAQSIAMGRGFKQTLTDIAIALDLVKLKGIAMQAALSFGLSIVITAVIEGLLRLAGAADAARQKNEELLFSYNQTIQQNNAHIRSLQSLADEYDRLNSKTSLTIEEQKRFKDLQEELANISPSLVQGYDEQGNVIIKLKGSVHGLVEELKEANRFKAFELVSGGKDAFNIMQTDIGKAKDVLESLNLELEHLQGNLVTQQHIHIDSDADLFWEKNNAGLKQYEEALARGTITEVEFLKAKDALENKMANVRAEINKLRGDVSSATDDFRPYMRAILDSSDAFEKLGEEQKKFLYDFVNYADNFGDSWDEASANIRHLISIVDTADFKRFTDDLENLSDELEEGTISAEEYEEEFNKLIVAMAELFDLDPNFLADIFKKAIPEVDEVAKSLKELNAEFDNASKSFDSLAKALDELDKYGKLSAKTMMDIVNNHEELIVPMLLGEMSLREALNSKMIDLESQALNTFKQAAIAKLEDSEKFFNEMIRGNEILWTEISRAYNKDGENFRTVAQAKNAIDIALVNIMGQRWSQMYGHTAQGIAQMIAVLRSQVARAFEEGIPQMALAYQRQIAELERLLPAVKAIETTMSAAVGAIDLGTISLGKLESAANKAGKAASKALKDPYAEWEKEANRIANEVIRIIQDAYRKQKKIALAAINEEIRANEYAHKERIRQLDDEYKAFEKLINQRIRAIDDEADEEDFVRELTKLKEEQAEIERNIALLALDDSFEARVKREALEADLVKKIEQINDLSRNRDKTLRKQALSDQLSDMKIEVDAKKDAENDAFEAEKERLEKVREETAYHYDELINNERYFAQVREDIFNGNLDNITARLGEFINDFKKINKDAAYEIGVSFQELLNIMDRANEAMREMQGLGKAPAKTTTTTATKSTSSGSGSSGSSGAKTSTPAPTPAPKPAPTTPAPRQVNKTQYNNGYKYGYDVGYRGGKLDSWVMSGDPDFLSGALVGFEDGKRAKFYDSHPVGGLHTGGITEAHSGRIAGNIKYSDSKALWDLHNEDLKPNEVFVKLLKNEVILNPSIALPKIKKNVLGAMGAISNSSKSMVVNNNFNIRADGGATDAKKLAKMTMAEMYKGIRRMGG